MRSALDGGVLLGFFDYFYSLFLDFGYDYSHDVRAGHVQALDDD